MEPKERHGPTSAPSHQGPERHPTHASYIEPIGRPSCADGLRPPYSIYDRDGPRLLMPDRFGSLSRPTYEEGEERRDSDAGRRHDATARASALRTASKPMNAAGNVEHMPSHLPQAARQPETAHKIDSLRYAMQATSMPDPLERRRSEPSAFERTSAQLRKFDTVELRDILMVVGQELARRAAYPLVFPSS